MTKGQRTAEYAKYAEVFHFCAYSACSAVRIFYLGEDLGQGCRSFGTRHARFPRSSLPTSRLRNRANPEGILQRSPGLRATSYPGSTESRRTNPNGVAYLGGELGHNPVGVETRFGRYPRVARRLATLGWRTQSLWDCLQWHPGLLGNDKPGGEGRGQPCKGLATEGEAAIFSHTPAVPC